MTILQSEVEEEWEVINPPPDDEAPYGRKKDGTPKKRPGRQPGSGGGSTTTRRSSSNEKLKEQLADRLVEYFGPPIGAVSPLALAVLDDRAGKTANGLVSLAAKRPRVKKAIDALIEGSSSLDVLLTGVGIMVAIGVDVRRVDIDSMPSRYFKIPNLAEETYTDTSGFYNGAHKGAQHHGLMEDMAT